MMRSGDRLGGRSRGTPDLFDLGVLVALALLSVWVLGWAIERDLNGPEVWVGVDSVHIADPMQYLAWIRDASSGPLISNPYRLDPTPASFLHPGFGLSGLLVAVGMTPWVALLLWKPVAILSLFAAVRAYVHRSLPGMVGRRSALVLALFYVPTIEWVARLDPGSIPAELTVLGLSFDMWPGSWLWGYPFTAIAVAALPAGLLVYVRDREQGRVRPWAPLLALLCSWLQPWQGATFLMIVVAAEVVVRLRGNSRARLRGLTLPLATIAAGAAPLVYYAALSRWDPSWATARSGNLPEAAEWWPIFAVMAPLALPALLAYGRAPADLLGLMSRLWPPAAVALYFLIERGRVGTFPLHAVQGLGIPLAVLACEGIAGIGGARTSRLAPVAAALAVAALVVPPLAWRLDAAYSTVKHPVTNLLALPEPMFLEPGERDALRALETDAGGTGVLTRRYLGQIVPGYTGRKTWVGTVSWTPDFAERVGAADALFAGRLPPEAARALVRSTGARRLLADCGAQAQLMPVLGDLVTAVHRYGCATVYEVSAR
jgi:hypothetical protein